jgi:hypothetical protein
MNNTESGGIFARDTASSEPSNDYWLLDDDDTDNDAE